MRRFFLLSTICDSTPRMREVSSDSKPVITEITTISAITPTVTPATDRSVIRETKVYPSLALR
ncbi:MAG: hypothetical protein HC887_07205 [Desulfobacteraceae bacterium]|nr:hypothetical protein [Desulfobacteraceae bacterium]